MCVDTTGDDMKVYIAMVPGDDAPRVYSGIVPALRDLSDEISEDWLLDEYMMEGGGVDYQAIHRDAEETIISPFGDERSISVVSLRD
jgi:hypothetical protein